MKNTAFFADVINISLQFFHASFFLLSEISKNILEGAKKILARP